MKKINSILSPFLILACLVFFIHACKKKDDAPADSGSQAKTLNKTTLTPKKWYAQGNSVIHDFKANNVYASTGTWFWKNNSDTMEIVTQAGYQPVYWKFYWNTDHEMSSEKVGTFTTLLFKDSAW